MKMTVQYAKLVSGVALHMPYALAVKKESIYNFWGCTNMYSLTYFVLYQQKMHFFTMFFRL